MSQVAADRRIPGYPHDPVREKRELTLRTYEYEFPFNYPNVDVDRVWIGGERHGMELFPIKTTDGSTASTQTPSDWIVIHEDEPMVRVAVMGSACTPPGAILLEADPLPGFRHDGETEHALPVRFRIDNLWGMHLRADLLEQGARSDALPIAGMSCAVLEIPPSKTVRVAGLGAVPGLGERFMARRHALFHPLHPHHGGRGLHELTARGPAAGLSSPSMRRLRNRQSL